MCKTRQVSIFEHGLFTNPVTIYGTFISVTVTLIVIYGKYLCGCVMCYLGASLICFLDVTYPIGIVTHAIIFPILPKTCPQSSILTDLCSSRTVAHLHIEIPQWHRMAPQRKYFLQLSRAGQHLPSCLNIQPDITSHILLYIPLISLY